MAARRTISVASYSLTHPAIISALVERAKQGVAVAVLLDGSPVGVGQFSPEWQTELYACREIEAAGGSCWFLVHRPADGVYSRYRNLHLKMIIVDNRWLALGSQNLTSTSLPSDDKSNGTLGSRGALLVTDAPQIVERASLVFRLDLDPANHIDVVRWNTAFSETYGMPDEGLVDLSMIDHVSYTTRVSAPLAVSGTLRLELITAPEAALRQSDGLLGLVGRAAAGDEVLVQQLYEDLAWGSSPLTTPNLRLSSYVEAARRGAKVRVLMNGRSFATPESVPPQETVATAAYLNQIAAQESLDLRAATGDPTGGGIHNKMVLVDLGGKGYVHLGSINGSETSSKLNRELAIQLQSDAAYSYLAGVFAADWWLSNPTALPVVARRYTPPPPPASHLLISEVSYTGSAEGEWVELYNPTNTVIDIGAYKLGDAEHPSVYEPMFQFPGGTVIEPNTTLVVAVNASEIPEADLEFYPSTSQVPDMVPYAPWGSQAYPLALRDDGDQVLLLGSEDQAVDAVAWGDRSYPGTTPHPGVGLFQATLERNPPHQDTDNCAEDFQVRYPGTPGELPTE
jgi:hypothetical protein